MIIYKLINSNKVVLGYFKETAIAKCSLELSFPQCSIKQENGEFVFFHLLDKTEIEIEIYKLIHIEIFETPTYL